MVALVLRILSRRVSRPVMWGPSGACLAVSRRDRRHSALRPGVPIASSPHRSAAAAGHAIDSSLRRRPKAQGSKSWPMSAGWTRPAFAEYVAL